MGEPGSRHHAEVTPLIIERPDLAHPLRRFTAYVVTSMLWCWWIVLWTPAFEVIADDFGWPVQFYVQPSAASYQALQYLLTQFPTALTILAGLLFLNVGLTELVRLLAPTPRRRASNASLPPPELIDENLLIQWQSARIIIVTHDLHGKVRHAEIKGAQ